MTWSSNFVRFMGCIHSHRVDWEVRDRVVRVTTRGYPPLTIVSVPTTTIESDPDEAREMVVTAVTLLNLFE